MKIVLALFWCVGLLHKTPLIPQKTGYRYNETKAPKYQVKKDSLPYSSLYFYRSYIPKFNAPLKKVPIYINDSLIAEIKANTGVIYRVFKEGKVNISIDKKGETQFPVKVKFGNEYFFKCEVVRGLWFGKPTIELVSGKVGREELGILDEKDSTQPSPRRNAGSSIKK